MPVLKVLRKRDAFVMSMADCLAHSAFFVGKPPGNKSVQQL